jgi:hypothetical protein
MKTAPGLSAAAIRAVARELSHRLNDRYEGALRAQPGRVLFPKRMHQLSSVDGEAPDGLSIDYVALALQLNNAAKPAGTQDLLDVLLRAVQAKIGCARLLEARLIEAMDREV